LQANCDIGPEALEAAATARVSCNKGRFT